MIINKKKNGGGPKYKLKNVQNSSRNLQKNAKLYDIVEKNTENCVFIYIKKSMFCAEYKSNMEVVGEEIQISSTENK